LFADQGARRIRVGTFGAIVAAQPVDHGARVTLKIVKLARHCAQLRTALNQQDSFVETVAGWIVAVHRAVGILVVVSQIRTKRTADQHKRS
jgi:hypothetical protein